MKSRVFLPIALAWASAIGVPVAAQDAPATTTAPRTAIETRADEVVALLNGKVEPADLFTQGFRAAITDDQLKSLATSLTAQFGAAVSATITPPEGTRSALEVRFERGIATGGLALDPAEDNRISELVFRKVDAIAVEGDTPQSLAAEIAALPGLTNAWFGPLEGSSAALVSLNPDTPLALGSAFKLYVLAALAEDVKAGKRQWSDVVPLDRKSFPSGQLQNWPQGAPVTLHTLASLMISISDNTATDQLITTLGKDRILKAMSDSGHSDPARNTPFLTTRELFVLKASERERIAGWRKSDAERRALILKDIDTEERTIEQVTAAFAAGPKALDIEWYASPADITRLFAFMRKTADPGAFAILAINPQTTPAIKDKWAYAGYKGGSEPGVINLTWLLTDKAGRDWVLTAAWNNEAAAVEDGKFLALAQRILLLPR